MSVRSSLPRAPAIAVVLLALAATAAALAAPSPLAPWEHAYAQSGAQQCPSPALGAGCTYHVTDTFPVGNIGAWHLAVDPDGERIYAGTNSFLGSSHTDGAPILYVFDMDYNPVGNVTLQGDLARIVDIDVNDATGELHVLYRWLLNAEAHGPNGAWGLNVTTINRTTLDVVATTRVRQLDMTPAGSQPYYHTYEDARRADLAVGNNMVFVTTTGFTPIAVINNSDPERPQREMTAGFPNATNLAAAHISAIAVNASASQTSAYVVSREYTYPLYEASLTTIRFDASMPQNYERLDRTGIVALTDSTYDTIVRYDANEIILDDTRDKLFVLWSNNRSVSMYRLDTANMDGIGLPRYEKAIEVPQLAGAHGIHGLALDEKNGILYSVVRDYTNPRIVAYNSSTGNIVGGASLSDQPISIAVDGDAGTVYAAPWWSPHLYVIDPQPETALQERIREAPAGSTVVVGPGVYADEVLVIDKPLTITSPTGQPGAAKFTGHSRIQVEADDVAIRGLHFEDTGCLPGLAASLVEIGLASGKGGDGSSRSGVTVEDNVFRNTCHAAIQQEGVGSIDGMTIRNNHFEGIGLKPAPGSDQPVDTGGEDEFVHNHGAIGLAFHPGQDRVSDSVISGNTIIGTSAAGIRVFRADNVTIEGNYIRDTPASAIGLSHNSINSRVSGNTIVNANSEPDFDYLAGISGSGDDGYYGLITNPEPGPGGDKQEWFTTVPTAKPTPDAAIKVWANSRNINVTANTIMGSDGAFVLCAGTCATETDGIIHGGTRNILPVDDATTSPATSGISFTGNVVYGGNRGDLVANNATSNATSGGALDATGNTFVGLSSNGDVRTRGNVNLGTFMNATPGADAAALVPASVFRAGAGAGIGASSLLADAERGLVYVGASPQGGNATLYVHNATGHSLVASYPFSGRDSAIVDMDLHRESGMLYVVHRWLENASAGPAGYSEGAWGMNVTAIDATAPGAGAAAPGPTARIPQSNATALGSEFWHFLSAASTAEVEAAGDLAFVSHEAHSPIVVVNMSEDEPSARMMNASDANGAASRVSAMAVDEDSMADGRGAVAYVYSRQHYETPADGQDYWSSITTVRFSASGASLEEYGRVARTALAANTDLARELVLDKDRKSLFVNFENGSLAMLKLNATVPHAGENVSVPGNSTAMALHDSPVADIALDEENGVLYALAAASGGGDPRLLAYNTTDGSRTGAPSGLLGGMPDAVSSAAMGGAYVAQADRAEVLALAAAGEGGNALQAAIDAAAAGSAIAVPQGAYNDTVLVVAKPLTLTSESAAADAEAGPVFGGASRIYVDSDNVVLRGLGFANTGCAAGAGSPAVQILAADGMVRSGVAVENSTFSDTCGAAVQTLGPGAVDGILVRDSRFTNIGLGGAAAGGGGGGDAGHSAIGLAHGPGQSEVRNARILSNTIENASASGVRVINASGAMIYDNRIAGTAAAAVGLLYGSADSAILYNAILEANSRRAMGVGDAAVNVWADSQNVSVTDNTISRSGGAMLVCAGACEGASPAGAMLDPGAYNVSSSANRVVFNWNIVHGDNDRDGAALIANDASGRLDATRNYYPGYSLAAAQVRNASTVDYSSPARTVTGLSTNASGLVGINGTIHIDLAFSVPGSLDVPAGAAPSIPLDIDPAGRTASYSGAVNSSAYGFVYAVAEGDTASALRHAVPSSLALNGASLAGRLDPPASLALPVAGDIAGGGDVTIDGIRPAVESVSSPSPGGTYERGDPIRVEVAFTEAVDVDGTPLLGLGTGQAGSDAEYASGSGTATLVFSYTVRQGDAAADLDYAGTDALRLGADGGASIRDAAGNDADLALPAPGSAGSLGFESSIAVDGSLPDGGTADRMEAATADAVFTGKNTLRIDYSAPLGPPAGYDGPVYGPVTVAGAAAPVADGGVSGLGTAVHTVRFGGDGVTASQTGTIALATNLRGEADGVMYRFTNDTIAVGAGTLARTAMPAGQAPVVAIERDGFVREVDVSGGGDDSVRPAINVTGLAAAPFAPGAANNTVTFPADDADIGRGGIVIAAPFARVSFPPNATAMSVPADGLLELYVSDNRPLVERVAEALNESASAIEVRKVIEVGDNETHIEFDLPVRILLVGQAGGTAFYVNNTDNSVVPIDAACPADETAAVHAGLRGAGACSLDSADGRDKIVYTYHLTRFSTARLPTALEAMVADAAAGSTVRVPPGTYAVDVLTVDKPLTIEPADPGSPPLFTNHSRIVVRQPADGPVVIRNLVFRDTLHEPSGRGLASITVEPARGAPPSGAASVTIEGTTFSGTCDSAIRAAAGPGAAPIAGLAIEGNRFYDIGGNRDGCASPPDGADAIVAGRYTGAAPGESPQLANMTVRDNHIFGTTYTGMRIAGADGLVVEGNHIEGVPDDGVRILPSRNVAVRGNTILGANSAPVPGHDGAAGAAIEVWSGSSGVAVTLNRISGSAGALSVCAGTCDPGANASDGSPAGPVQVAADGSSAAGIRFNHNVLAASNTGYLIANGAGGMLNARANYYPGHAASAADRASPAGAVSHEPALGAAGPVRIGAVVADGAGSSVRSIDAAVRAAFELGVHAFNARQAEIGGFVGLEPEVLSAGSPDSTPAARAGHAAAIADLRSGASADARMLPVLHNSISSAMAAYDDAPGSGSLAAISAMEAEYGHYPFVVARNGTIVAHGANASLVGDSRAAVALAGGTRASLDALFSFDASGVAQGVAPGHPGAPWKWWTYEFADPETGEAASKRTAIALHAGPDGALHNGDDLVFGAGYYPGAGAAHLVVAAGDAPAAVDASGGAVAVSPTSTAAQLAAPDMLFRLAPPDGKLAGVVLAQAAADFAREGAVVVLNDSASLQSMGLAGELDRIRAADALPDGVSAVRIVSYNSSAADGWASGAASSISSALSLGQAAAVYAGRADAFAALADAFGASPPSGSRWYATGELARAELAASGQAAAFARAVQLTALLQHAAPNAVLDAALAAPGTGIVLDESTRGPAYAAYDAPGLLGRAIVSTADVPGEPAEVAAAIGGDVARTHNGALGSPLILDRNGDLVLPVEYAVSSIPSSDGAPWDRQSPNRVGELTCGISLEKGLLDFGSLALGERSRIATQTVINAGTLPYASVALEARNWVYAIPGVDSLPASITELREVGRAAEFSEIRNGTVVASGLGPGMDRDIQYRINLTGYTMLVAGPVSQTVYYLVTCAAPPSPTPAG